MILLKRKMTFFFFCLLYFILIIRSKLINSHYSFTVWEGKGKEGEGKRKVGEEENGWRLSFRFLPFEFWFSGYTAQVQVHQIRQSRRMAVSGCCFGWFSALPRYHTLLKIWKQKMIAATFKFLLPISCIQSYEQKSLINLFENVTRWQRLFKIQWWYFWKISLAQKWWIGTVMNLPP